MAPKHLLFVGGGSGGHITPLLSVMEAVQKQDPGVHCSYVGLKSDLQSELIARSPLPFEKYSLPAGKLNRFITWKHFGEIKKMLQGIWVAEQLLRRLKPDLIFVKGGFVGVTLVLAAARQKIPVFCHETDVVAGLANRLMARYAQVVFTAYPPEFYKNLPPEKLVFVGQPVRAAFRQAHPRPLFLGGKALRHSKPILTVIGGSLGAHRINVLVEKCWSALLDQFQLVHISGSADLAWLEKQKGKLSPAQQDNLWLLPFVNEELPAVFQKSSLIISRAGGTIAEVAACHKPLLLLPLSSAAQGHQKANAWVLQKAGAALVLDELKTDANELTATIRRTLADREGCETLGKAISQFDHPLAAEQMAQELLKFQQ